MMKIIFALYFIFFFQIEIFPQATFSEKINNLFLDTLFESSVASVNIYDLTENKLIYEKNTKLLLHPASNLKILTSIAGLYFLGPDYQFITSVYHSGDIVDSVCYGDLFIVGGGDPEFSVFDLDTMVMKVKEYGIKEIKGNIYGDSSILDSLFWGKGWMWDDDPSYDAPYLSALNINRNSLEVFARPSVLGEPAEVTIYPESGYYKLYNNSVTISADTSSIKISRNWVNRTNNLIITGGISGKELQITEKLNIYDPAQFFLTLFQEKLKSQNIRFNGQLQFAKLDTTAEFIYSKNRPLKDVMIRLNKDSDNLAAEMTLRALSLYYYNKPAKAEKGITLVDSLIKIIGLNPKKYRIVDGSGVSHYNLVTSELILEMLKYVYYFRPDLFKILYDSFPLAGVDGTLKKRMKDPLLFSNVHAKTGTLSGVSCLSGYLSTANGHLVAFSIFNQNYVGSSKNAVKFQDSICKIIAEIK